MARERKEKKAGCLLQLTTTLYTSPSQVCEKEQNHGAIIKAEFKYTELDL